MVEGKARWGMMDSPELRNIPLETPIQPLLPLAVFRSSDEEYMGKIFPESSLFVGITGRCREPLVGASYAYRAISA